MRFLVDTNVFLDFLLQRDTMWIDAKEFFIDCMKKNNQIYITSMSLRDIGYSAHRHYHNNEDTIKTQINAYSICTKVIGISADSAITSLYSDIKDYEDSLIIEAAKEAMVDAIITSNKKDYTNVSIPIFTPKEIVNYLNK